MACGPWFPNRLLDRGDEAVLVAPFADFAREIERMQLVNSRFSSVPLATEKSHVEEAAEADLKDLQTALFKKGMGVAARLALGKRYEAERQRVHAAAEVKEDGSESVAADNAIAKVSLQVPEGVPDEFADYLRGAAEWAAKDTNAAIASWSGLLARPAQERRFKSTWAAFMLGKAWGGTDPEKARNQFQAVRTLAKEGFSDSLGLAASSFGWEAKTYYDQEKFLPAAELYLEQAASGDRSAMVSLRWLANKVIKRGGTTLEQFARHPKAQRIITAYWLANHSFEAGSKAVADEKLVAAQWLEAMEAVGVKEVASAEQLALVAYRYGEIDKAQRWLKLSRNTPVSQWLQAKLLLRDGKVDEAAALLARAARFFPLAPEKAPQGKAPGFQQSLFVDQGEGYLSNVRIGTEQLWGELGVVRLARRDYAEALEALLRADFWDDAAYVAERVLTLDELKGFVDRRWLDDPELAFPDKDEKLSPEQRTYRERLAKTRQRLCHLLGRHLVRNGRGIEARAYFDDELLPHYETLMKAMEGAFDEAKPAQERAQQLMATARLVRNHGIDLLATELEPDFAIYEGQYEGNISPTNRLPARKIAGPSDSEAAIAPLLGASADERRRTATAPADPFLRFHYRYVAAEYGWLAAKLLPDNTDEKARMLCESGSWIKNRNPAAADRFYKELVRKCRRTPIGQWADYIRWFPLLDAGGNLLPNQPGPPERPVQPPVSDSGGEENVQEP